MKQQDVERLIAKYLDGQTSPEEEKRLALALDSAIGRGDAPQEWRVVAQMLGELTLGEALYDKMIAERRRRKIGRWASLVAAASVALLLGLWLVPQADIKVDSPPSVAKTEVPVRQMKKKQEETRQEEKMPVEETPCTSTASDLPMLAKAKPARKSPNIRIMPTITEEVTAPEEAEFVAEETIAEEDVPTIVQEVAEETSTTEEIDIEELRRTYSKEIAQVGQNYYEWEKKQSISLYKMMMNARNEDIERQYVKYSKKDNIINYKQLPI